MTIHVPPYGARRRLRQILCAERSRIPFPLISVLQTSLLTPLRLVVCGRHDRLAGTRATLVVDRMMDVAALLFGLIVVDQELAVLSVPAGLVARDLDNREPAAGALDLVEDGVHLLEGSVGRLGVPGIV